MLTVGSLFSGIGGIELGLERTGGFETKWQVEIDPYCHRVLEKHWPSVRRWDDVRTFPPPAWVPCPDCDNYWCTWHDQHAHDCQGDVCPDLETWDSEWCLNPYEDPHPGWRVDMICGGDPCQENSGVRRGDYTTQQSLGGEFVRVVAALRPRFVLRENPSHIRKDAPWPWWRVRTELESLGYACVPFRLRACCVGAQHRRERLFVFAERTDTQGVRLEGGHTEGSHGRWQPQRVQALVGSHDWPHVPGPGGYGSRDGIPGGVERIRAIGNSVVPQVAQWIGERILVAAEAAGGSCE